MDVSGVIFRRVPCFPGAGFDAHSHYSSSKPSFSGLSVDELRLLGSRGVRASPTPRKFSGFLSSGFCDNGHVQYYSGSTSAIICGSGKKEKMKEKDTAMKNMKKKLKLLKDLSKDLSTFSGMGFGLDPDHGLADQVKGKMISEASELLLGQLQQLKAEEKELKRKRKEEKAKLKAIQMQNRLKCEVSSSSSSESSDSECGEVVDMNRLKSGSLAQSLQNELQPIIQEPTLSLPGTPTQEGDRSELQPVIQEAISVVPCTLTHEGNKTEENVLGVCTLRNFEQECCTRSSNSLVVGASAKKIEVCMGGKCKKSGGAALLDEFQRVLGVEGAVAGCKCMGKCRDGPNVRVLNHFDGVQADGINDSVRTPTNPLCIGVGLDDVNIIVANFFGENQKNLSLASA